MQILQQEFTAKCIKGNQAFVACCKPDCENLSLMCVNDQCQCLELHSQCQSDFFINKLRKKVQNNNKSFKGMLSQIFKWYQNHIKLLTIEMESVKHMIQTQSLGLMGNQDKLYNYLVEGKSDLINSSLVSSVHTSIQNKQKSFILIGIQQTTRELKKYGQEFIQLIKNIRSLVEVKTTSNKNQKNIPEIIHQNYVFSSDLRNPLINIIDKCTSKNTNSNPFIGPAALLQPCLLINNSRNYKVKFKIDDLSQNSYAIAFGVYQITPDSKIKEKFNFNLCNVEYGVFAGGSQNRVILGQKQPHELVSNNITSFYSNDIVEVEYQGQTQKVRVRNLTKNVQCIARISVNKDLPLYFGVIYFAANCQVRIIDSNYQGL